MAEAIKQYYNIWSRNLHNSQQFNSDLGLGPAIPLNKTNKFTGMHASSLCSINLREYISYMSRAI